jgi:hypothetical protein
MLKDYILIIIAIAIIGVAYIFLEDTLSNTSNSTPSPTPVAVITDQKFTSEDGRVTVTFPSTWHIAEATPQGTYGQFGLVIQTFTITNYSPGNTALQKNGVRIDFTIEQGGGNLPLESLLDCGGKTLTCERVGIDNEQFIQSTATLNTGMQTIGLGTFYDQNILVANALIAAGNKQATNKKEAEKILRSIKFNAVAQ